MCFNLLNLCLPASTSNTSSIKLASNIKSRKSSSNTSNSSSHKKFNFFTKKHQSESTSSSSNSHDHQQQKLNLESQTSVQGDQEQQKLFKGAPYKKNLHALKFLKKLSKSNNSFDNFSDSGAQNLTFRLFHSKLSSNYLSIDAETNTNIEESVLGTPRREVEEPEKLRSTRQFGYLTSSSVSSSSISSNSNNSSVVILNNNNFSFLNNKMKEDNSNNMPGPSYSFLNSANNNKNNINNNDKFVFTPPRPLFTDLRSKELNNASSRPIMTPLDYLYKPSSNSQMPSNKTNQPELKLDELQIKKRPFYFNTEHQLLAAKTNQQTDAELSRALDDELNNSNMEIDDPQTDKFNSNFGRNNQQRSSNHSHKHHHHHHHHSHHQHHHKSKGGKLTISKDQVFEFKESDLKDLGQIGNGEFGTVHKVLHMPSQTHMALKRIGPTVGNQVERKKVLKELDFVLECNENPYVVKFYGVKFNNEPADCLICMELMDTSLEKFYKFVYDIKKEEIPEAILGKIIVATVNALNYLKEEHSIIHRDVKPSNILVNRLGEVKICDFGISGKLVDSIAASRDAGCQLYMAPERIDPTRAHANGYGVRSDIWSLGISLYELSTGKFPYPQWKTIFHQLNLVVDSDAPRLENERLTKDFREFVNMCLTKDEKQRPKYNVLLQHPLIKFHTSNQISMRDYFERYITEMQSRESNK